MQRRNSIRSQGLLRQKSANSVKSVQLVHIDPGTAEHDAQSAAIQAFARARERSSNGNIAHWPPPRSVERPTNKQHQTSPEGHPPASALRRQQSVRFIQLKASGNRLGDGLTPPTPSRESGLQGRRAQSRGPNLQAQNLSSFGMASAAKGIAGGYVSQLITEEEHYTPEDNIASLPSSYRRIRKSKSMYTGLESSQRPKHNPHRSREASNGRLRAPKSMSFLRSRRQPSDTSSSQFSVVDDDNAPLPHPKLVQTYDPMLAHSTLGHSDKLFKKTLRGISTDMSIPNDKTIRDRSFRLKARKVSQNLKHKLKNMFTTLKGNDSDATFPAQQVEAQRTHVTGLTCPDYSSSGSYLGTTEKESTTVSRVTSGVPSFHIVPSEQQLRSRQGSLESLRSISKLSDEKSRVTSWSDSDATTYGTVNSSRCEWDKQRLSVIKETGAHIAGCAHHRHPIDHHGKGSDNTAQPVATTSPTARNINGQRVYSALMKRLDNGDPVPVIPTLQNHPQKGIDNLVALGLVPNRGSSIALSGRGKTIPSTIRPILTNKESELEASRKASISSAVTEVKSKDNYSITGIHTSASARVLSTLREDCNGSRNLAALSTKSLTNLKSEKQLAPGRTISERSSVFFGSPSSHFFRTQSPYRRALQGSMRAVADVKSPKSPEYNPWMKSLSTMRFRRPSICESEEDLKLKYDESVYSNDSEFIGGIHSRANPRTDFPKPPEHHGDATIFLDPPKYGIPKLDTAPRVASFASSVEWKTWLSAKTSGLNRPCSPLERRGSGDKEAKGFKLVWPSGHYRENAQIEGDDEIELTPEHGSMHSSLRNIVPYGAQKKNIGKLNDVGHPRNQELDGQGTVQSRRSGSDTVSPLTNRRTSRPSPSTMNPNTSMVNKSTPTYRLGSQVKSSERPDSHSMSALRAQNQNVVTVTPRHKNEQYQKPVNATALMSTPEDGAALDLGVISPSSGLTMNENTHPRLLAGRVPHGSQQSGCFSTDSSPMRPLVNSKSMVDMFLDSRRRDIGGTDSTDEADAFL